MNEEQKKELSKHKFIVFCSDHYNSLGVVRSLGEAGIASIVILICDHIKPRLITKSKYPQAIYLVNSKEEGLELLISKWGKEKLCKPFVYSCSDDVCELLDQNYNKLHEHFYFFHGNREGIVTKYLNKYNINLIAEKYGCNILKNEVLKKGEIPSGLKYPVITKALLSTLYAWKDEMHICNDEKELIDAYKEIKSDKILVQQFIKKKNELCLDGFSFNAGNDVYIPYYTNYLRYSDLSYGAYMVLKPFDEGTIYSQIKNILKEIGFTGIFSVEFLVDENSNNWFLEINFRNSTWSYAYTYGGYNMPYLWAIGTIYKSIEEPTVKIQEFKAMSEYEDYKMSVLTGNITFKQWKRDFKTAEVHYLYNKADPRPWSIKKFIFHQYIKSAIRCIAHILGKKFME